MESKHREVSINCAKRMRMLPRCNTYGLMPCGLSSVTNLLLFCGAAASDMLSVLGLFVTDVDVEDDEQVEGSKDDEARLCEGNWERRTMQESRLRSCLWRKLFSDA